MKPADLAKSGTESGHQRAVFAWAAIAVNHGFDVANRVSIEGAKAFEGSLKIGVPELKWLHAIPNGGARGDDAKTRMIRGNALKAEGVRAGVSDMSLPVKRGQYSGLYIEMKKPGKLSGESAEQKEFGAFVRAQGFGYVVCDHWEKAVAIIQEYMQWK